MSFEYTLPNNCLNCMSEENLQKHTYSTVTESKSESNILGDVKHSWKDLKMDFYVCGDCEQEVKQRVLDNQPAIVDIISSTFGKILWPLITIVGAVFYFTDTLSTYAIPLLVLGGLLTLFYVLPPVLTGKTMLEWMMHFNVGVQYLQYFVYIDDKGYYTFFTREYAEKFKEMNPEAEVYYMDYDSYEQAMSEMSGLSSSLKSFTTDWSEREAQSLEERERIE